MKNSFEVSMNFFRKFEQFFISDFLHLTFPKRRWIWGMCRTVKNLRLSIGTELRLDPSFNPDWNHKVFRERSQSVAYQPREVKCSFILKKEGCNLFSERSRSGDSVIYPHFKSFSGRGHRPLYPIEYCTFSYLERLGAGNTSSAPTLRIKKRLHCLYENFAN